MRPGYRQIKQNHYQQKTNTEAQGCLCNHSYSSPCIQLALITCPKLSGAHSLGVAGCSITCWWVIDWVWIRCSLQEFVWDLILTDRGACLLLCVHAAHLQLLRLGKTAEIKSSCQPSLVKTAHHPLLLLRWLLWQSFCSAMLRRQPERALLPFLPNNREQYAFIPSVPTLIRESFHWSEMHSFLFHPGL